MLFWSQVALIVMYGAMTLQAVTILTINRGRESAKIKHLNLVVTSFLTVFLVNMFTAIIDISNALTVNLQVATNLTSFLALLASEGAIYNYYILIFKRNPLLSLFYGLLKLHKDYKNNE